MIPIMKKELLSYFNSMIGYIFLGFTVLLNGIYFSIINILQMVSDYSYVLSGTSILFLILIPILTMRLFAEEAKQKTDQLLYTSPVPIYQIVLGKYFSAFTMLILSMIITIIFPLLISPYGSLPVAKIASAYLGYILLGGCFISVGMFISVITDNQIVSAVATFSALFIFFILNSIVSGLPADRTSSIIFLLAIIICFALLLYDATKNLYAAGLVAGILTVILIIVFFINQLWFDGVIAKIMGWFSLMARFENFNKGILNIADIIYYITFSSAFVYVTIHTIEKRRWR